MIRNLPRLFSKLFCQPILLEDGQRMAFEQTLLSVMLNAQWQATKQDMESNQRRAGKLLELQGDTAIVHIDGTLDRHLTNFEVNCFDATDVNDVMNALRSAANNPDISNVMLYFNSPGGSISGIPETANLVADLAQKKNVFAYTDGLMCSAAYWIAAQCDQIFANESAQVGSIGVYLALLNSASEMEKLGRKIESFQSGDLKTAGAYWKPLTEAERAHLQSRVDDLGVKFRAAVTAKRPQVKADAMRGQSIFGGNAVAAGLIDAVRPTLNSALAEFRK
jgi:signal peptide peptidase SppA